MKKAMVIIEEKLQAGDEPGATGQQGEPLGYQLLQVHDSILVECKKKMPKKWQKFCKAPWKTSPLTLA